MNDILYYELTSGRRLRQDDLTPENLALVRLDSGNSGFLKNLIKCLQGNTEHRAALIEEAQEVIDMALRLIDQTMAWIDWETASPSGHRPPIDIFDQDRRRFLGAYRDFLSEEIFSDGLKAETIRSTENAVQQIGYCCGPANSKMVPEENSNG